MATNDASCMCAKKPCMHTVFAFHSSAASLALMGALHVESARRSDLERLRSAPLKAACATAYRCGLRAPSR